MKLADQIEQLIDDVGLAAFLGAVEDVCTAKADHLVSAWQDEPGATVWAKAAAIIAAAESKIRKTI